MNMKRNKKYSSFVDSIISDEDLEFYNRGTAEGEAGYWDKEDILDFEMYVYYTYFEDEDN